MGYIPERTCMGCNKKMSKYDLIRIVKSKEGINIDKTGKIDGRGAYICNNVACFEKIIKTKKLERCFKTKLDNEIYERLRGVLIEQ